MASSSSKSSSSSSSSSSSRRRRRSRGHSPSGSVGSRPQPQPQSPPPPPVGDDGAGPSMIRASPSSPSSSFSYSSDSSSSSSSTDSSSYSWDFVASPMGTPPWAAPSSSRSPTSQLHPPSRFPVSSTALSRAIQYSLVVAPPSSSSSAPAGQSSQSMDMEVADMGRRPGKRERVLEIGSSSRGPGADKRGKGELDSPRGRNPRCTICWKEFQSWKAYFGHLRSHPERQWRGAFPPPVGPALSPEERLIFEHKLVPTLMEIATKLKVDPPSPKLVFPYDLNRSPPSEDGDNNNQK